MIIPRRLARDMMLWSFAAAFALPAGNASAQTEGLVAPRDLPRPGFETGRITAGGFVIRPTLQLSSGYDSNLFATSANERDVAFFHVAPRIEGVRQGPRLRLGFDAGGEVRRHSRFTTEDTETFGLGGRAAYGAGPIILSGRARFDRAVERRSDPEANPTLVEPAKIDLLQGGVGLDWRGNRLTASLGAEAQKVNYLDSLNADRDLATYRLFARLGVLATPRLGVYVQPYLNRRDARLALDRSGIDRDATTLGLLGGVDVDIASRWQGRMGAGWFRADPDDPALQGFSGFAIDGTLQWSPNARTLLTGSAFRGDVATVRSGASGRIDTRLSLRLDQEIRHNLLGAVTGGWSRTSYRGNLDRKLSALFVQGEVEYLLNRNLGVYAFASHEDRSATLALDRFNRSTVGVGVRLRV